MTEREVEKLLVEGIRKIGGRAYKWVSPGNAGVPDRIVVLPGGRIIFIELKTDTGKLTELQKVQIGRLERMGADARVLKGPEAVKGFLKEMEEVMPNDIQATCIPAALYRSDPED